MSTLTLGAYLLKSLGLVLLGLALAVSLRRSSANRRHLVLATTLGALLLLPAAELVLPTIALPVLSPTSGAPPAEAVPTPVDTQNGAQNTTMQAPSAVGLLTAEASNLAQGLGSSWWLIPGLMATLLLMLRLLVGILRLGRLVRGGTPVPVTGPVAEAMASAGIDPATCSVRLVPSLTMPFTCGLRPAVVALPAAAADWPPDFLRSVLTHELSHVRRRDWLVQNLARFAVFLHWFNPFAWLALRQLRLEAEHACDDAVLQAGGDGPEYASELVRLARCHHRTGPAFGVAMASPSQLERRVLAILDPQRPRSRSRSTHQGRIAAATIACLTAAVLGALVPAQRSEAAGSDFELFSDEDPPLLLAARRGDTAQVARLLDGGADIDQIQDGDGTALIAAAADGQAEMVELLLDRGADIDLAVPGDGTALIAAAADGHLAIVELLLRAGADPDLVVPDDENPLIQAAESGHLEVVQTLVEAGADVNIAVWANRGRDDADRPGGAPSSSGELRSPLSQARRHGHDEVVDYLQSAGAVDR